jgi:ArsR family transcriptional regulator, arsenate/arsenite/antimonite-responsive transcriptional repressor
MLLVAAPLNGQLLQPTGLDDRLNDWLHAFRHAIVGMIPVADDSLGRMSVDCGGGKMERSRIEQISKALADETRLEIFEAIAANEKMSCGDILACQKVTGATISHHLKVLADAGLIECCKVGPFVHSRVVPETMEAYTLALGRMTHGKSQDAKRR